jgi:mono/diheme cytochrome c family protein
MRRLAVLLVLSAACGGGTPERAPDASAPRPRTPGVRVTMADLHAAGGVPRGWKLTPPPGDVAAGRATFVDLGCHECHRVEGEPFTVASDDAHPGPELTGMAAHHPAAYFVESILNPDAILVDGPRYIDEDGHSAMPDYPDLTARQLGDLVAYLVSLKTGGPHAGMVTAQPAQATPNAKPHPPDPAATAWYVQSYDISPEQLGPLETWWTQHALPKLIAFDGLVSVDTYVDFTRPERPFTTVFAFRDGAALQAFSQDPPLQQLGLEWDSYIGEHTHVMQFWAPVYRVPSLSGAR